MGGEASLGHRAVAGPLSCRELPTVWQSRTWTWRLCLVLEVTDLSVQVQHAGLGHGLAQGQETEGDRQTLNTEPGEPTPEWGSLLQAGDLVQTVP